MSYTQITRTELEDWLSQSGFEWSRNHNSAGIYFVNLSDEVAIKISSTIGSRDDVMGKGRASADMMLVSRINGRCLNRKAKDRKHFKRTSGWRKTWADGLRHWVGVFNRCPDFYARIAHEAPRKPQRRNRYIERPWAYTFNQFPKASA